PIWLSTSCPPPMCKIWPNEGKLPPGACLLMCFMSQNGTMATLQLDNGTPFAVPLTGTVPIFPSQLNPSLTLPMATLRVTGPCGVSICAVQFTCGPPPPGGENGQCIITVSPQSGDCSTQFVASWTSSGITSPHLMLDTSDLGAVPAVGSLVLPT